MLPVIPQNNLGTFQVIATRPVDQAQNLYHLLQKSGFFVLRCPTIKIVENKINDMLPPVKPSFIIFTSTNAVHFAFAWLKRQGLSLSTQHWLAIGSATKLALQEYIKEEISMDNPNNSQGLLALPILQSITNQSILIFKGKDGLNLLETTLKKRGANPECIEVYHREITTEEYDFPQLHTLLAFSQTETLVILATSATALTNLLARVEKSLHSNLFATQVIAASARIAQIANELGFHKKVLIAANSSDEEMVNELKKYKAGLL